MNPSIIKISLDLNKHGSQIQIPMFRGDTKRIIQVSFTQNGVPYILSECNVAFTATKPDGTFLNCTCDVDENKNIAIYDLDKDNGDSDNHKQTTAVEGKVECQFVISSVEVVDGETVDHKIASAEFDVLVMKTIYNEEDILNSEVALGALAQYYVPVSRNIAGVDLTDNISTEELGEELLEFFSIHKNGAPPVCSTETYFIGQRWIDTMRNDIYVLRTIVKNHYGEGIHNYQWEKIAKHSELSDYVQKTRTIAGLSLNNDITAEELQTALDVYPVIELENAPDMTSDELEVAGKVGQIGVYANRENMEFYRCTSVTKHPQYEDEFIYEWEYLGSNSNLEHLPYSSNDAPFTSFKDTLGYMKYFAGDKTLWLKVYGMWLKIPLSTDVENKVDKTTTVAGIDLAEDITAEELKTALDVKGKIIINSALPPTNDLETLAEVGDFWLISKDQALYVCYGKQATDNDYANYFWLNLTDYLKDDTTLAELTLKNNITADELKGALEVSTIGTLFNPPTSNTVGEYRQLVCVGDNTKFTGLYLCLGKQTNGTYKWVEIAPSGNGDVDLSGYVPTTREIANYELSADITVSDLQKALETYPIIDFNDYEDYTQVGEIGQLGIEGNGSCFDLYIQLGEGYGWVPIINTDRVIERSYLVSSVDENSTDVQVPSAKLFYDTVGDIETALDSIITIQDSIIGGATG